MTRSTRPSRLACLAFLPAPVSIMGRALGRPMRGGRRCVPPDPGNRPNSTWNRNNFITVSILFGSRCFLSRGSTQNEEALDLEIERKKAKGNVLILTSWNLSWNSNSVLFYVTIHKHPIGPSLALRCGLGYKSRLFSTLNMMITWRNH